MKRFFSIFLLLLAIQLSAEPLQLSVAAEKAILINAETGAILYEKNSHVSAYPASTTKVATALYALHVFQNQLDRRIIARQAAVASITPQAKQQSNYRSPPHWLETDGTHISIKRDEEFRVYDLLCGMLISSANDAANVIAQGIGGTVPQFMEKVNAYLKKIGCNETSFNNPHGLHHPDHRTTAYDLALMTREALKDPAFRQIVSMSRYTSSQTNFEHERTFVQTNLLLRNGSFSYPRAIGVKTGTTKAAGKNLIAAAEEDGRTLIAVLLNCRGARAELYRDVIQMFDTAFEEPKMRKTLLKAGAQQLTTKVARARGRLRTMLPEGLYYDFYPSEETEIKAKIAWSVPSLPLEKGAEVGVISLVDLTGNVLKETPIFAARELKVSIWRQVVFFGGVGFILFFLWKLRKKRSRRPLF